MPVNLPTPDRPQGADQRPRRVLLEHSSGVDVLTLDNAEHSNAIDWAFVDELASATRALSPDAGALLIRANGPRFSVGGDLKFLNELPDGMLESCVNAMTASFHGSLACLSDLDVPVVLAAKGAVAGGALGFLAIADVALVSPATKFATVHAANGLSLDGGASWLLPRTLGVRRTIEMYLDGRVIDADEAVESGLVTRTVTDNTLDEEAFDLARRFASRRLPALREARQLLDRSFTSTFVEQLAHEAVAMSLAVRGMANRQASFNTSCSDAPTT